MKRFSLWAAMGLVVLLAAGCAKTSYKKTPGGMPYKIYRSKDTQRVMPGNYIKISVLQKVNDSVLISTKNAIPIYLMVNNQQQQTYDISEIWTLLHKGDSIVTVQAIDTFIKRAPQTVPPQFKKGDQVTTRIRVLDVFTSDSLARADEMKAREAFLAGEIKDMEKYLADKKITAQKTVSGAFVEIIKPGEGNLIDTGNYISVNYNGTGWSGKKFDSNTDSAFNHVGPFSFVVGARPMIKGFDEGLCFLRKGSVARFYIPSTLGYGPSGSNNIKPYEHLIFDIEVTDVQEKAPAVGTKPETKKVDVTQQK